MNASDRKLLKRQDVLHKKQAKLLKQKAKIETELVNISTELNKPNWFRLISLQAQKRLEHWPPQVRSSL